MPIVGLLNTRLLLPGKRVEVGDQLQIEDIVSVVGGQSGLAQRGHERVALRAHVEQRGEVDEGLDGLDDLLGDGLVQRRLEQDVVDEEEAVGAGVQDLHALAQVGRGVDEVVGEGGGAALVADGRVLLEADGGFALVGVLLLLLLLLLLEEREVLFDELLDAFVQLL